MIFLGIFFVIYAYLAIDFVGSLHRHGLFEVLGLAILLIPFVCVIWLFRVFWNREETTSVETAPDKVLVWSAYLSMGLVSFVFVYCLVRDLISLILLVILRQELPMYGVTSFWIILSAAVGSCILGFKNARYVLSVSDVRVKINDLPQALDGLRIAQISDLHIGSTIHADQIERVIATVNQLKADIIVLTGDIVDGYASATAKEIALLGRLQASLGRFYSTGNHEYYWGAPAIIDKIKNAGITVLINENVIVEKEGHGVLVAGVPDYMAAHVKLAAPDASLALRVAAVQSSGHDLFRTGQKPSVKILLAHQPSMARAGVEAGFDIQFSGHTHGGQFFPWTLAVKLAHKYPRGLYRVGSMWLYVNRGTGYWGPPLRLGSPAEVTLMTLQR